MNNHDRRYNGPRRKACLFSSTPPSPKKASPKDLSPRNASVDPRIAQSLKDHHQHEQFVAICSNLKDQHIAICKSHMPAARPAFQFNIGLNVGLALSDCVMKLQRLEDAIESLCIASEDITEVAQCLEERMSGYSAKNARLLHKKLKTTKATTSERMTGVSLSVSKLQKTLDQHHSAEQQALEHVLSVKYDAETKELDRRTALIDARGQEMRDAAHRQQKQLNEKMKRMKQTEAELAAREVELDGFETRLIELEKKLDKDRKQLNGERKQLRNEKKQFKEKAKKFKEHEHAFKEREDAFKEHEDALCAAFTVRGRGRRMSMDNREPGTRKFMSRSRHRRSKRN